MTLNAAIFSEIADSTISSPASGSMSPRADLLDDKDPATGNLVSSPFLSGADAAESVGCTARAAWPAWQVMPPRVRVRAVMNLHTPIAALADASGRMTSIRRPKEGVR